MTLFGDSSLRTIWDRRFQLSLGNVILNALYCRFRQLITHRFASHVIQTFLIASVDTITRETRGIFPATQASTQFQNLRSLTDLVLVICEVNLPWSDRTNLTGSYRN